MRFSRLSFLEAAGSHDAASAISFEMVLRSSCESSVRRETIPPLSGFELFRGIVILK